MLDLNNLWQSRAGKGGFDLELEIKAHADTLEKARKSLLERLDDPNAMLGWINLPNETHLLASVETLASELETQEIFTDLVVLGIGGSSLGGQTVVSALQHPARHLQPAGKGMRVHFVDNVDGDVISGLIEALDAKTTLINVISKSGTTTETMAAYLVFKDWLEHNLGSRAHKHIIATTDPLRGVLRPLATSRGYRTLDVPQSVGGRYSVFSPVGLLPIRLAGIDITRLLQGARKANDDLNTAIEKNAALLFALANTLSAAAGRKNIVFMPYSTRLRFLADWFAQLWAESLGKQKTRAGDVVHAGTTPIKAVGTTDQHSQVQLYMEGPDDKLFTFIAIEQASSELIIPNAEPAEPDMNYLGGQSMQRLLNAELEATANALARQGRGSLTFRLERLDEIQLGWLMQTLMLATAITGELWQINAFDQPGVELGKQLTYALMGRPGFEALAQSLQEDAG